jgi:hypothetical protein
MLYFVDPIPSLSDPVNSGLFHYIFFLFLCTLFLGKSYR